MVSRSVAGWRMRRPAQIVVNMLAFQLCWLAFVGGAGRGLWWPGFVLLLPFALWQLSTSEWPRADLALLGIAALLGFGIDSVLQAAGLLRFATPVPFAGVAPAWIVGLWMAFALTLNHSLSFLKRRLRTAAAIGALAGPVAYWIASRAWEALTFATPDWRALLALAIAWGAVTPFLVALAARLALREVRMRASASPA